MNNSMIFGYLNRAEYLEALAYEQGLDFVYTFKIEQEHRLM